MRWFIAAIALLSGTAAHAASRPPSITVVEPRAFGYFLGDVLSRQITVRLAPGEELDSSSLPRPGPLNYWLEISRINHTETHDGEGSVHTLDVSYQTFYTPLDPRSLTIPGFKLKLQGDGEIAVPAFSFITSPIRQLFAAASQSTGSAVDLQVDEPAPRLTTGAERTALLASAIGALIAMAGLAWHNAWWPFNRRPSRPFTEAARFLRSNASSLDGASGYRAALLKMHRAFDIAAGRRVLADDVQSFLGEHPEFHDQQSGIDRLFLASRRAFFANDVDEARADMPLAELVELSAQLSNAERRAA
jgi:mxaA protein